MDENAESKDCLMILNENDGSAKVVTEMDGKGKVETAQVPKDGKEYSGPFMEFSRGGLLEVAMRNYQRQLQHPQGLNFILLPAKMIGEAAMGFAK